MDLDAFVSEHGAEWNRLQTLSVKRRRTLTAAEIDEMVTLYRRAATHLSVVRSRSGDPTLVSWLSRLVLQARAAVTPSTGFSGNAIVRFFTVSFPAEIYNAGRWCLGVAAAFVVLTGAIIAMVANDERIALAFLSSDEIDSLVERDFVGYYSEFAPQNFTTLVWTNNALVTAICLAGGVLILPTVYMLWSNALNGGIIGGVMVGHGRSDTFFGLLLIHGMLELTCIFVGAGVGLRIAWAWIAPGHLRTRTQALAQTGRSGMVVALGLAAPLFLSAIVEGFVTPSPAPVPVKLAVGVVVWLAFLGYVIAFGARARAAGQNADVDTHERAAQAPVV